MFYIFMLKLFELMLEVAPCLSGLNPQCDLAVHKHINLVISLVLSLCKHKYLCLFKSDSGHVRPDDLLHLLGADLNSRK